MPSVCVCVCAHRRVGVDQSFAKCASCMVVSGFCGFSAFDGE